MPLHIPVITVKDKQAFVQEEGAIRLIGNPAQVCRDLAGKGAKLIHIVDADAKKGQSNNMDIYDSLTFFVNIQVECRADKGLIDKLLGIKARAVIPLPAKIELAQFKNEERLMVGMFGKGYDGSVEGVHDVVINDADDWDVVRFSEQHKRVIVSSADYAKLKTGTRKLVWGVLETI